MLGTLGTTPYVICCGRKQLAREFRENWFGEKVAMYLCDMKSFEINTNAVHHKCCIAYEPRPEKTFFS